MQLPSVRSVWAIFGLVALATVVTYWRLPAQSTYHFADHGASGAGSRLVSYLSYPVALAAIAVAWAACRRRDALIVTALCATVAVPGVVSSSDLTASWAQAPSAAGVLLAFALTLRSDARVELSRWRWAALGLLAVWSIPWLFAAWGLYVSDVPGLGSVFMSHQPTPGERSLPAVHLGLHDGLFGAQLAATALILSAARLPRALLFYLALLLVYGLGSPYRTDGRSRWSSADGRALRSRISCNRRSAGNGP